MLDVSSALSNSGSNVKGSSGSCLLQLQALEGYNFRLTRPDVLTALTRLTSLSLVGVAVKPGSLLAALPQLLQLQDLDIGRWRCQLYSQEPFTVAQLRDALTPLTQLTALGLSDTMIIKDSAAVELQETTQLSSSCSLQPGVGGLFPGLHLPRLQVLDANLVHWADSRPCVFRPLCGTMNLQAIATAAPLVSCMRLKGSISWTYGSYLDLQPLTAVAASLTRLEMSAEQQLQDGHLQFLAQLPGLSSLTVADVGAHITDRGIVALSALSALSHLELFGVLSSSVSMELLPGRGTEVGTTFKLQNKWDKVR